MISLQHGLKLSCRPCQEGKPCGKGEFCPCPLRDIYAKRSEAGKVSREAKAAGCKPALLCDPIAGSSPALPTTLPSKGPLPKMCSCGELFTDGQPLYCHRCGTFTHTVYWIRRPV